MRRSHFLVFLAACGAVSLMAADSLDDLKKFSADGLGSAPSFAADVCHALAPAPYGSFVPANVPIPLPGLAVGSVPFSTTTLGTAIFPGTALEPATPRLCSLTATGISQHDPPGKSTWTLNLSIDASTSRPNGFSSSAAATGLCSDATGTLTFVKTDSGSANDSITMRVAGLFCDTDGPGGAKVFSGAYHVAGGTRKYTGADGTGNVSFSFSGRTLLHVDGNVLMAP